MISRSFKFMIFTCVTALYIKAGFTKKEHQVKLSWREARARCNGTLYPAGRMDKWTKERLLASMTSLNLSRLWMNWDHRSMSRQWVWANGSAALQQQHKLGSQFRNHCGLVNDQLEISAKRCKRRYPALCEFTNESGARDSQCEKRDDSFTMGESCYKIYRHSLNWTQAYTRCAAEGGKLAILDNQTRKILRKNERIMTKVYNRLWIGLRQGSVAEITAGKGNSLCKVFDKKGYILTGKCSDRNHFICHQHQRRIIENYWALQEGKTVNSKMMQQDRMSTTTRSRREEPKKWYRNVLLLIMVVVGVGVVALCLLFAAIACYFDPSTVSHRSTKVPTSNKEPVYAEIRENGDDQRMKSLIARQEIVHHQNTSKIGAQNGGYLIPVHNYDVLENSSAPSLQSETMEVLVSEKKDLNDIQPCGYMRRTSEPAKRLQTSDKKRFHHRDSFSSLGDQPGTPPPGRLLRYDQDPAYSHLHGDDLNMVKNEAY